MGPVDAETTFRRERERPADVCGRSGAACARGIAGLLDSGAAGDEGWSDCRATV